MSALQLSFCHCAFVSLSYAGCSVTLPATIAALAPHTELHRRHEPRLLLGTEAPITTLKGIDFTS